MNVMGSSPVPEPGPDGSGLALVSRLAPGARAVKGLNTLGSDLLGRAGTVPGAITFMAGDDAHAKEVLAALGADLGFAKSVDVGGLNAAPLIKSAAVIWITLAVHRGRGAAFAFAFTRP